ncbi:MAG: hypothetical protein ABIT71_14990 [Vicinamibacteraceae bacterium]
MNQRENWQFETHKDQDAIGVTLPDRGEQHWNDSRPHVAQGLHLRLSDDKARPGRKPGSHDEPASDTVDDVVASFQVENRLRARVGPIVRCISKAEAEGAGCPEGNSRSAPIDESCKREMDLTTAVAA